MMDTMKTATTLSARDAARTMTLNEYRLWWYELVGLEPPKEPLSVRQQTDERIIREGYRHRRSYEVPIDSPFCPVNQARRTGSQPPAHDAGLRDQTVLCEDHNKPICDECRYCVEDPEHQKHVAQSDTGQPGRGTGESGDLPVIASYTALLDMLDAAKVLIAMNNCNYDRDQMRRSGGFQGLEEAVGRVEALRQGRGKEENAH